MILATINFLNMYSVSRVVLDLEVAKRNQRRLKKNWKKQVENERECKGLKMMDALTQVKWRDGAQTIAKGMG